MIGVGPWRMRARSGWLLLVVGLAGGGPSSAAAPADASPAGLDEMRELALELLREGDYERSIAAYRAIAEHTPGDARSHYELAASLVFLRMFDEAVEPIETARRLSPDDREYHAMAALVYMNLRQNTEAFEATLDGARLGDTMAMYTLVAMYGQGRGVERDLDQAVAWANAAADGGHLGAMALMARIYREGLYGRDADSSLARFWDERLESAQAEWRQ